MPDILALFANKLLYFGNSKHLIHQNWQQCPSLVFIASSLNMFNHYSVLLFLLLPLDAVGHGLQNPFYNQMSDMCLFCLFLYFICIWCRILVFNDDWNDLFNLQVSFEDILGEPAGAHSIDCVWKNSYKCFNCGKNCCYKFLTTLCEIFIALHWGCEFAIIAFQNIWCFTPLLRCLSIIMGCCQKFYSSIVSCCLAPLCETCGLCFSQIKVQNK